MNCEKANQSLHPYADLELPADQRAEVERHLENCPSCQGSLRNISTVKVHLKRAVSSTSPPFGLETRIRAELRSTRPSRGFWGVPAFAMAGTVMILTLAGWASLWRPMNQRIMAALGVGASDHVHCTLERKTPPGSLNRPTDPEYGDLVAKVRESMPGDLQFAESHFCRWQGRRFQHIVFTRGETKLSVIVTPKEGAGDFPQTALSRLAQKMRTDGIPVYGAEMKGLQVAGFSSGHNLAFVVSDLSEGETMRIVAGLAPAIRGNM